MRKQSTDHSKDSSGKISVNVQSRKGLMGSKIAFLACKCLPTDWLVSSKAEGVMISNYTVVKSRNSLAR